MMVPTLKKAKPPPFSGEDTSLAIINAWIFKIGVHIRASTDEEEKVEIAASFLTGMAELWFMAKYALASDVCWSVQTGDRPETGRLFSGLGSSRVLIFTM